MYDRADPLLHMKSESIAFAVAGVLFGLIAGWIIGSQQARIRPAPDPAPQSAQSEAAPAPLLDEARVNAFKSVADREPQNAEARVQLGNLYYDAERYDEAIVWYEAAQKLSPKNPDLSTDLGVSYYYTNQPDRALQQFERSLDIDPRHVKTWLNLGIVRAFGKQDLEGAAVAWQKVLEIAPDGPEGQAARRALESMRSAHPGGSTGSPPGS
jgi:tetratricopeptide (TPR) repeat protein